MYSTCCSLRRLLYTLSVALLLTVSLSAGSADAQRASGNVGLGGQIGSPSGVTLKFYNAGGPSYDFLGAWDLNEFFFLNAHAQFSQPIRANNVSGLEWFFGPGAFIGVEDDEAALGISGRIGINWMANEYIEFFGQLTPRLNLAPDTDGDFGGGLGLRYYF
ncbi:hypothetical protein CRI93_00680 [Longimonas halophila]|uniref:Uncharacterized protein n=1 Tax=Longimonas halophila TaxID=1469170 RepID=A0A2H3NQ05_9BACT|nr:hypothetical protein CRI93_00680 [Longimonas halophila]